MRFQYFCKLLIAIVAALGLMSTNASAEGDPFRITDYFRVKHISELAISSDGEMIAYIIETHSLSENKSTRTVYVSTSTPGATHELVGMQGAHSITWIPGRDKLGFLFKSNDTTQLYSYDIKNKEIRQITHSDTSVTSFQFAPDGASVAWLAKIVPDNKAAHFYGRVFNGDTGVAIDTDDTVVYQFITPEWSSSFSRPDNRLWVKRVGEDEFQASIPGSIRSFYWSTNSTKLSITYTTDIPPLMRRDAIITSIGYFDATTKSFQVVAQAEASVRDGKIRSYSGGEWLPAADKIYIRRSSKDDAGNSKTEWALVDLATRENESYSIPNWHSIEMYGGDTEPAFIPNSAGSLYSVKTIRAQRRLYKVTSSQIEEVPFLKGLSGSVSLMRFSADFNTAVFVSESLNRPPEIYIYRNSRGVEQLSDLNDDISRKRLPDVKEITWTSKDGVIVQGWLFEPLPLGKVRRPWPLITFVHGGPTNAFVNEFAKQFNKWPFPLEVYATRGIAVFVPNYRGTATFGRNFIQTNRASDEPVDDIISGIHYLVREQVVDPERLAICGYSVGSWLASLVLTRMRTFRAGVFAEGPLNMITLYQLMPGWLNRSVHDVQHGVSLYENPQYYIDVSPDLHFEEMNSAVLFEAGARMSAITMMGSPKAAKRAGMPTEFMVYPKTGHSMTIPRLQLESATRNLDWFRFWLQGHEDEDPKKADQYARWRKMRDERCAWDEPEQERPSYCEYSNAVQ